MERVTPKKRSHEDDGDGNGLADDDEVTPSPSKKARLADRPSPKVSVDT
jgi:hypothetical protein